MIKLAIGASVIGLGILGSVLQPSWAPEPIPLEAGQTYRTGSPLSKPGLIGLFGAIGESIVGGDHFKGGGAVTWDGQNFVEATARPRCPHIVVDGEARCTYQTLDDARAASDAAGTDHENKQRAIVPDCADNQQLFVFYVPDDEIGTLPVYVCK